MTLSLGLEMKIRQKLAQLTTGQSFTAVVATVPYEKIERAICAIATSRRMVVKCTRGKSRSGHDTITCLNLGKKTSSKYNMTGLIKPGDSKTFEINPSGFTSLRSRASAHATSIGCRSSVDVIAVGKYRVTLLDPQEAQERDLNQAQGGRPSLAPSQLKYPIGDLAEGESVLIDVPRTDHQKLRVYVSAYAIRKGWKLSCNKVGDAIRVTRLA